MAVGFATTYIPEYMKARFSAGLIFKMLGQQPKIDSYSTQGLKPVHQRVFQIHFTVFPLQELGGEVTFENVEFRYETRPDAPVLEVISAHKISAQCLISTEP